MAYKHVIRAKTKNLLNISDKTSTLNGVTLTVSGNLITLNGTATVYTEIPCNITSVTTTNSCVLSFEYRGGSILNYTGTLTLYNHIYDKEIRYPNTFISGVVPTTATNALSIRFSKGVTFKKFSYYLQLEQGSTSTPYTPYNYLQSNKRMIKVSNVCQLLDKSKYNLPYTESGLTFTAGADGSIIVNGTCTSTVWANISLFNLNPEHTFLLIGCPSTNVNDVALYTADSITGDSKQWEEGKGSLVTGNWYKNKANYLYIRILTGYVCNNLIFKPQLYDLTEMFGAGHEPATVAEFRQKFSDELYPYSPQCWLTSYQSAVICKTKNLFDYKTSDEKTQTNNGITLILNTDYFELSGQQQVGKYIELGQSGFNIPFEIGKTYVLSADTIVKSGGKVFMRARYTDGESPLTEWETVSWNLFNGTIAKRFTPTRPGYFDKITFYNSGDTIPISGDYIIRIQIEQGSTATPYVPYQHL